MCSLQDERVFTPSHLTPDTSTLLWLRSPVLLRALFLQHLVEMSTATRRLVAEQTARRGGRNRGNHGNRGNRGNHRSGGGGSSGGGSDGGEYNYNVPDDAMRVRSLRSQVTADVTRQMTQGMASRAVRCCAACHALESESVVLSVCARCKGVRYCGAACQRSHWKAGHKGTCAKIG